MVLPDLEKSDAFPKGFRSNGWRFESSSEPILNTRELEALTARLKGVCGADVPALPAAIFGHKRRTLTHEASGRVFHFDAEGAIACWMRASAQKGSGGLQVTASARPSWKAAAARMFPGKPGKRWVDEATTATSKRLKTFHDGRARARLDLRKAVPVDATCLTPISDSCSGRASSPAGTRGSKGDGGGSGSDHAAEDAVAEQIKLCDPEGTLQADDFFFVLTDVTDTVVRVMKEEQRTELDDTDLAYITQRVRSMVHPSPGASEAMMVTHHAPERLEDRNVSDGAKEHEIKQLDHVVCRLARRKWASGVVHSIDAGTADDDGAAMLARVHVTIDAPNGCTRSLVTVPETACYLHRAAAIAAPCEASGRRPKGTGEGAGYSFSALFPMA